jgi:hypothetical protein
MYILWFLGVLGMLLPQTLGADPSVSLMVLPLLYRVQTC